MVIRGAEGAQVPACSLCLALLLLCACQEVPTEVLDQQPTTTRPRTTKAVFTFAAIGDTQHPVDSCILKDWPTMGALPRALSALMPAPRFILHLGDLVDRGGDAGAYEKFESCYADVLERFPLFPTMGNHDDDLGLGARSYISYLEEQLFGRNPALGGEDFKRYLALFYLDDPQEYSVEPDRPSLRDLVPSGVSWKTYYAFRYRNSYFISFELTLPYRINTPPRWVEKHLSAARADPAIDHIFVFMHHPLYLSLKSDDDPTNGLKELRTLYEPLFRQYDVTLVFSGHHHVYSHVYVPDDGSTTRSMRPPDHYAHDGNGIHYIVSGGGSWMEAPLVTELQGRSYDHVQAISLQNHFVVVGVADRAIELKVVGVSGTRGRYKTSLLDAFSLMP